MFYHLAYLRPSSQADRIYPVQRRERAKVNRIVGRALVGAGAAAARYAVAVARGWAAARAETARRARLERETIRELSALSDAALADIGLRRGDIRSIARGLGAAAAAPAPAAATDTTTTAVPAPGRPRLVVSRPAPRPMLPVEAGLAVAGEGRMKACA